MSQRGSLDRQSQKGNSYSPATKTIFFCSLLQAALIIAPLASRGGQPNIRFPGHPQEQVNAAERLNLRFSPRSGQTLVYNLQTRMDSEGEGFLGKNLTLSAEADVETLEEQNPLNFSVLEVLSNYWPAFPDRPLSPGESWPDHKRIVVPFQGMSLTIELEVSFTLNTVTPAPGGRLALIAAAYTASLSGDRQVEDFRGAFEGRGTGTGSLVFQVDSGFFSNGASRSPQGRMES
ncbi:MAG: hypothetical protein WBC70_16110 [Candidatus Aminicenantales bacterium]